MDEREEKQQFSIESFRVVMTAAHNALKCAILVNGGAAVATLALVGSLIQHGKPIFSFGQALGCFALGVLMAAVAAGLTYLTQSTYYHASVLMYSGQDDFVVAKKKRRGDFWKRVTITNFILSLLFFLLGCWFAYHGLTN
jgi:hypothetical protein